MSNKWRFPCSNHGQQLGISTGDIEAFKKAPYEAFAREVLQNSVDARLSDEEPVKVEFSVFEIKTTEIPGCVDLKAAIRRCKEFWMHKTEYVEEYTAMEKILEQETIKCLRVSDFNTTGLIGVESHDQANNQFLALTKGSGVSEKTDTRVAGGSKGMGKNAAFLMSSLRTVFYSTKSCYNIKKEEDVCIGSIGVAKLVSGYVSDDIHCENRDYTQGTGFYCADDFNNSLNNLLNLDDRADLRKNNFGTDIYILGFMDSANWEKEIINSILNSFMVSIMRGHLEIVFNEEVINKQTVIDYIYDNDLISKGNRSNIISQYRLLKGGDDVSLYDIETAYGNCILHVLPLSKEESDIATHKCAMIRYPYMKIKDIELGASFRVSAMCIIENDNLGKTLREIENAQHIDWEPKRLKEVALQREMTQLLREIKDQIVNSVIECLKLGDAQPIDPYGADSFLPDEDIDVGKATGSVKIIPDENVTVSSIKENKYVDKHPTQKDEYGSGLEPIIASVEEGDGEIEHPIGRNDHQGGGAHAGEQNGVEKEGDSIVFKRSQLSGVRYKVVALGKNGNLRILFTAPIDYQNCYLNIKLLDDANNASAIDIIKMVCNDKEINSSDSKEFGPFEIKMNQKIVLNIETSKKGYFASEVKIICK